MHAMHAMHMRMGEEREGVGVGAGLLGAKLKNIVTVKYIMCGGFSIIKKKALCSAANTLPLLASPLQPNSLTLYSTLLSLLYSTLLYSTLTLPTPKI